MNFLTYLAYLVALIIASFLAGISFFMGESVFNTNSDDKNIIKRHLPEKEKEYDYIDNPGGFIIFGTNARIKDGMLEITGVVSSIGERVATRIEVDISLVVFAGTLEIGRYRGISEIKANENTEFSIECRDITGFEIPDFIRFEPRISGAWIYR